LIEARAAPLSGYVPQRSVSKRAVLIGTDGAALPGRCIGDLPEHGFNGAATAHLCALFGDDPNQRMLVRCTTLNVTGELSGARRSFRRERYQD
jgi:hypothetical protein